MVGINFSHVATVRSPGRHRSQYSKGFDFFNVVDDEVLIQHLSICML